MNLRQHITNETYKKKKEWIVYNNVQNCYSVMDTMQKEYIEREFWDNTHDWKIFRWTQELEDKLIK